MDPEELAARGLFDPDAPDAADRLAFLKVLLDIGVEPDKLERITPNDPRIWSLVLRPGPAAYTLADAAGRAGLEYELAERVWRAAGLPVPDPNDAALNDADVKMLANAAFGVAFADEESVLQAVRVMATGMRRLAETTTSLFAARLAGAFIDDRHGVAQTEYNRALGRELVPRLAESLEVFLRHHLIAAGRTDIDPADARGGYDTRDMSVAFVDIVDSTTEANRLPPQAVGDMFRSFDELAHATVFDGGGRVVKLIGDEVFFTAPDAATACRITLDLLAAAATDPLIPILRGGIASGPVLNFQGDCFGPVVARAARIVGCADPGGALVDAQTRELLGYVDDLHTIHAGDYELKGFDDPVALFALGADRRISPG